MKLCSFDPDASVELHYLRSMAISKDLYGNDVMSSFELAKGSTKPVTENAVTEVPENIFDVHNQP